MSAQRMLFLTVATLISVGIALSGYQQVHWFLFLPPMRCWCSLGITGICPGLIPL